MKNISISLLAIIRLWVCTQDYIFFTSINRNYCDLRVLETSINLYLYVYKIKMFLIISQYVMEFR